MTTTGETLFDYVDRSRYPVAPGFKARDTSFSAAKTTEHRVPRLRQLCTDLLLRGPLTADECASRMGVDKLSIRPRFSELATLGKIQDTGGRRRNESGKLAIVWELV